MKRRFLTVLILRPTGARFRRLHLSYGFAAAASLLVVILLAAGLVAPRLLYQMTSQSLTMEQLSEENTELRKERELFETTLADVSGRLDAYEVQARRIAQELGVADLVADEPAAGGSVDVLPQGRGWLTGETRNFIPQSAIFGRVTPRRNFHDGRGKGPGAWQVALRFEKIDLTDHNINGGTQSLFTAGATWLWNPKARVLYNLVFADVGGPNDGRMVVFEIRFQFDF